MSRLVRLLYGGLAWIVLAVVVVQFFLAGVGVFGRKALGEDAAFGPHAIVGLLMVVLSLILLLLAAASGLTGSFPRRRIGLAAILFVLMVVQMLLGGPAQDLSFYVAALHPVNALLILGVSLALARPARTAPKAARNEPETLRAG